MDSVRNATFRIAFRRHMSLCAPFAASRWTDIWRLFYPEMAILTLEKASRAYRTLRGAFLISENGIAHFGRASRLVDTMRLLFILKWQYLTKLDKCKKITIIVV